MPRHRSSTSTCAFQGEEGVEQARGGACSDGRPYALAFVDMRMPPGWDGVKTIELLWQVDPSLQVVICSAQADYEWNEVAARLNFSDRLLMLRKPFEPIEVQQCASALCQKWHNERPVRGQVKSLEKMVVARTRGLGSREPPAAPHGHARFAHRAAQPRAAGGPPAAGDGAGAAPWTSASRCWCATWTASSWSTIPWATMPVTCSCRRSRGGWRAACARAIRWRGRAATSSCSC